MINLPVFFGALHGTPPPGSGLEPAAGGGTVTFSSGGAFTMTETLVPGMLGTNKNVSITGTYQLTYATSNNPIVCSGAMSGHGFMLNNQIPFHFQLIVSSDGSRVEMLETDTGTIDGISNSQMPATSCSNATIGNDYTIGSANSDNTPGWELMPSAPTAQKLNDYVPLAISGAIQFSPTVSPTGFSSAPSGAASLTAWENVNVNGGMVPVSFTGWYLVNSNCTGSLLLHPSSSSIPDMNYQLFIAADGSVEVVDVDSAVTLSGGVSASPLIIGAKLSPLVTVE